MTFSEKNHLLNTYSSEVLKLKTFLSNTDYKAIRAAEGGEPMPDDVRTDRANARARINELEVLIAQTREIEPEAPQMPDFYPMESDDLDSAKE